MVDKKDKELEYLEKLATEFRIALLKCNKNSLIGNLRNFPKDSCGESSLLLGKYLNDMNQGIFEYTLGEIRNNNNNSYQSHAWLQKENIFVEITADQFPDVELPPYVTIDNPWYDKFKILESKEKDIEKQTKYTKARLLSSYDLIISNIKLKFVPQPTCLKSHPFQRAKKPL
ncbi:MAG: hypothetical protein ACNFW9_00100 [Candidatus Kerfeldbacteria bacterium]